jgi:hypothetical protein
MDRLHHEPRLVYSAIADMIEGGDQYPFTINPQPPRQFRPLRLVVIGVIAFSMGLMVFKHTPYAYWDCIIVGMVTLVILVICICMLLSYEHHHPRETCSIKTFGSLGLMFLILLVYLGYFLGRSEMGWRGQNIAFLTKWRKLFILRITFGGAVVVCIGILGSTGINRPRELRYAPGRILLLLFTFLLLFMHFRNSVVESRTERSSQPEHRHHKDWYPEGRPPRSTEGQVLEPFWVWWKIYLSDTTKTNDGKGETKGEL